MLFCSQSREQRKTSDCGMKPTVVKEPENELAGNRECVKALFKRSHPPGRHGVDGMSFAYFRIFRSTAEEADRRLKPCRVLLARRENDLGGHTREYHGFESEKSTLII